MSKRQRTYSIGSGAQTRAGIVNRALKNKKNAADAAASAARAAVNAAVAPTPMDWMPTGNAKKAMYEKELKGVDQSLAITAGNLLSTTNTNGSSFVINLIQPGSASYNRVGRKTYCKSLRLRGIVNATLDDNAGASGIASNVVRMVVVWDKQPSGALPAFDTIFGKTDQTGAESCTFQDSQRYDNTGRFQVLRDVTMNFVAQASMNATIAQTVTAPFDEFIKLGNRESVYSGQSSPQTIADISTGALYVYFRARVNAAASSQAEVEASSFARLRFTD